MNQDMGKPRECGVQENFRTDHTEAVQGLTSSPFPRTGFLEVPVAILTRKWKP